MQGNGGKSIKVLSDSQLVVNQTNGNAEAKSEQMKKYCALVSEIKARLVPWSSSRFPEIRIRRLMLWLAWPVH